LVWPFVRELLPEPCIIIQGFRRRRAACNETAFSASKGSLSQNGRKGSINPGIRGPRPKNCSPSVNAGTAAHVEQRPVLVIASLREYNTQITGHGERPFTHQAASQSMVPE
jgi:hypothetical protein